MKWALIGVVLIALGVGGYFGYQWYSTQQADTAAWEEAAQQGTVAAFQTYLQNWPDGSFASEAAVMIDRLGRQVQQAQDQMQQMAGPEPGQTPDAMARPEGGPPMPDPAAAEQARDAAESAAWEAAQSADTVASYCEYLRNFPTGEHAADADDRIARLEAEERRREEEMVAWEDAQREDNILAYELYLEQFPDGMHLDEARGRIDELKKAQAAEQRKAADDQAWAIAENADNITGYEAYLKSKPKGQYVSQAKSRIEALNKDATADPKAVNTRGKTAYADGNFAEAVKAFRNTADRGDPAGTFNLGLMYELGRGVDQNYSRAIALYREAADKGNVNAMLNLGFLLEQGRGVAADPVQAADLFESAAAKGSGLAEYNLGVLYAKGRGVEKDLQRARDLLSSAAGKGVSEAQATIGVIDRAMLKGG